MVSGIITDLSAASEDFTCRTATYGAEETYDEMFISEADVDMVESRHKKLLLRSNLQAEETKGLHGKIDKSETDESSTTRGEQSAAINCPLSKKTL